MLGGERRQFTDELAVTADAELDFDAKLEGCQPDLLEPGDRTLRKGLVGEVGERRAAPERERVAQEIDCGVAPHRARTPGSRRPCAARSG